MHPDGTGSTSMSVGEYHGSSATNSRARHVSISLSRQDSMNSAEQLAKERDEQQLENTESVSKMSASHSNNPSMYLHTGYATPQAEYTLVDVTNGGKKLPVQHKDVHREGGMFTPIFVKQAIVMSLWFFTSFTTIVLNKYILSTLDVDAGILGETQIVMTTFFGGVMMYLPICISMKSKGKHEYISRYQFFRTISFLGLLRCGAVICSVFALKYVAVSFSETIKSSAPLFTAIVAYILLGEYSGLYVNLSLIPVMLGLALSTSTELSFNMTGFVAACCNNILDCIQNVFSKKLLCESEQRYSPLELQFYTSVAATIVQMPLWLIFLDVHSAMRQLDEYTITILLFNSIIFYAQSLFAYLLMSLISPVTFSVSNTVKRAGLIWFSILVFSNKITIVNALGTLLVLFGVFLYQRARHVESAKREEMKQKIKSSKQKKKILPI